MDSAGRGKAQPGLSPFSSDSLDMVCRPIQQASGSVGSGLVGLMGREDSLKTWV